MYLPRITPLIWLLFLSFYGCSPSQIETKEPSPNIVLFMVDDLGWQDLAVPFGTQVTETNRLYRTPNLQRLASEGMKFTQAYATAVCSPTRVSLLTGMNAARHRVTNWTLYQDKIQPMETDHEELEFPLWNVNGISPQANLDHAVHATTFPMILQEHGYTTIHVGKAHFGAIGTPGAEPLNLGFDFNVAGHAAGAPKSYYGLENFGNTEEFAGTPWPVPGLELYHGKDIFLTEALTLETLKILEKTEDPFFLYYSFYGVHTPIMADKRFVNNYLKMGLDSTEAAYASMIEAMDKGVGDILNYLEEQNLAQNTIVLFMSDNGGLSAVARGGNPHTHNRPLASGKGSIYEGGIREPMMVRWPGRVTANSTNNQYLIIEDFFPTILEMAGIQDYHTVQVLDGVSFTKLLEASQEEQSRPLFWHYPNEWGPSGPGIGAYSAIRMGAWKLIYYHLDQSFELFNLESDIGESQNLVQSHPQKKEELAKVLGEYLASINAQMPKLRTSGEVIAYPHVTLSDH